ncbi:MAG TPA: hypothetical protein VEG29_01140, partial [Candidatus Binatia bacterium]|nr:hypothetical protein [Candidatus Binatia bacterium]
ELTAGTSARLRFRLGAPLAESDRTELETALRAGDRGSVDLVDEGGGRYRLDGPTPDPGVVAGLATWGAEHGAAIVEVRTSGGTLEERYLELVGEAGRGGAEGDGSEAPS